MTQLPAGFHPVHFPQTLQEQQHPSADSRGSLLQLMGQLSVMGEGQCKEHLQAPRAVPDRVPVPGSWEGARGTAGAEVSGAVTLLHMNEQFWFCPKRCRQSWGSLLPQPHNAPAARGAGEAQPQSQNT